MFDDYVLFFNHYSEVYDITGADIFSWFILGVFGLVIIRILLLRKNRPINLIAVLIGAVLVWWGVGLLKNPSIESNSGTWGIGAIVVGAIIGGVECFRLGINFLWLVAGLFFVAGLAYYFTGESTLWNWMMSWF